MVENNIFYQDNQSAINLEKNAMESSRKRTMHINVQYFFVNDRIAAKELNTRYYPTLDIIRDYFTKPFKGKLFRKFRNPILCINEFVTPKYNAEARSVLKSNNGDLLDENEQEYNRSVLESYELN